ncbi:MAG TPA: MBL fold metallo-hydrolase [Candidatus Limnocylindria bacterium]|nr:MBL fold metallo-hydrolase [Candidatus Limnocylindria bacterium]
MSVQVRFIGSGNAFNDGGRSHACIHLTAPGVSLLLDCGGSSLPAIKRYTDPATIEAIAVSHLHGDHFAGITFLVLEQHFAGRSAPLAIAGPAALEERLGLEGEALYPDFFRTTKLRYPLSFATLGAAPIALGGALVSALPVRHVQEADPHGLRVRVGETLIAYSGDARWSEHLPLVSQGADLFICEASSFERHEPAHISYRDIMAHRAEFECKRMILTHLGQETLDRAGELELPYAVDGLTLEV